MRFMVMVKATSESESGALPDTELLAEMGRFNEELVTAGVMQAGEGLQSSSKGARVHFSGSERTLELGPFTPVNELVAGFWIWQVASLDEAIAWVKRCPNPFKSDSAIEIRQIFSPEDFAPVMDQETAEQELRLRGKLAEQQG